MSNLTLFHHGPSTCSQKVRLILGLKDLTYESKIIDLQAGEQHDAEYIKLNPNHVVPTLICDEKILVESSLILEFLEDKFPEKPARSKIPEEIHQMRLWMKTIDAYHIHGGSITYGIGVRNILILKPKDELDKEIDEIPDLEKRENRRDLIENGLEAKCVIEGLKQSKTLMDKLEIGLKDREWFSGSKFGLADASIFPYVLRWEQLTLTNYCDPSSHPLLNKWFKKIKALPFYEQHINAYIPVPLIEVLKKFAIDQKDSLDKLFASF